MIDVWVIFNSSKQNVYKTLKVGNDFYCFHKKYWYNYLYNIYLKISLKLNIVFWGKIFYKEIFFKMF